jgi:hypothetical protein
MREIIVVTGFLVLLFMFFWIIVVFLELLVKGSGVKRGDDENEEEGEVKEILPVIVAGVEAYKRSFTRSNIEKRVLYKEKGEKLSLWRVGGRNWRQL